MAITRRRLLKLSVAAFIFSSFTGYVLYKKTVNLRFRAFHELEPEGTTLENETLETLVSASESLIGMPIKKNHYSLYFKWRAENLQGYAGVYRKLVSRIRERSVKLFGKSFQSCSEGERSEIIRSLRNYSGTDSLRYKFSALVVGEYYLFEKRVFREILELFSRTDAFVHLGYRSWPGKVRGLHEYQRHPVSFSSRNKL